MTKHGSMIALSCDIYVPNALICPIKLIKKKKESNFNCDHFTQFLKTIKH